MSQSLTKSSGETQCRAVPLCFCVNSCCVLTWQYTAGMWKVANDTDDNVLDLSLNKSSRHSAACGPSHVVASSYNALPTSAAAATVTSSPVIRADDRGVTAQMDTCDNSSNSDEDTRDEASLFSSSVPTLNSRCRPYFDPRFTHLHPVYSTVSALSDHPPVFDLCTRSTTTTTTSRRTSALSTLTTCSARSTPKRARQQSGQDDSSSSSSSIDTSQRHETMSERCCSEPLRLQASDDMDDVAYGERRRKNNEAAKRSRDARRLKERQTAVRAAALEQENVHLKAELVVLRNQAAKLHCLLYNKLGIWATPSHPTLFHLPNVSVARRRVSLVVDYESYLG